MRTMKCTSTRYRAAILALVAGCTAPHDPLSGTYLLSARLTSHLHPTQCVVPTDTYCFTTDSISETVVGHIVVPDDPRKNGAVTTFDDAQVTLSSSEYLGVVSYGSTQPWEANVQLGTGVTGRIPSATLLGHYDGNSIVGTISSTFGTEASVHQMEVKSGTFRADRIIYVEKPGRTRMLPAPRRQPLNKP